MTIRDRIAILAAAAGVSITAVEALSDAGQVVPGAWGCFIPDAPNCGSGVAITRCPEGWQCCYLAFYSETACLTGFVNSCCPDTGSGCNGRIRDGIPYTWCGGPNDDPYEDPKTDPGIIDF